MDKKPLGVYVHIPFCQRKCLYCDFNSYDNKTELKENYTKALIGEISAFCADEYFIDSIFFGGGTPTTLPLEMLDAIFKAITDKFTIAPDAEISCETNPGVLADHTPLKAMGFNRLSMGLQSANDDELKRLGRIHTYSEFLKSYENARKIFDNINIDTMFALPDQTVESWTNTLERVKGLAPEHISCYSLIVEDGTPFAKMPLKLPDEETDRQMYYITKDILSDYNRYEISNYAKDGFECRHNIKYWTRMPYIGFGCGAHSQINHERFSNQYNIADYIKKQAEPAPGSRTASVQTPMHAPKSCVLSDGVKNPFRKEVITLSEKDEISEFIFLGLRMTKGVDKLRFKELFGKSIEDIFSVEISRHIKAGTLISNESSLHLPDRGIDVSNSVMADFILE